MRILGHMYHLGWGWGGGVVTMVLTLEELRQRGHSVGLMLQRGSLRHRTFGGRKIGITDVYSAPLPVAKRKRYNEADIVITQGEATPEAVALCRAHHKPLAHLIHDEGQLSHYQIKPEQCQLAIYNAGWVQRAAQEKGREDNALVLHPLIFAEDYQVEHPEDAGAIMLVNLCEEKGGKLFWELVRRMPDHQFVGVKGGWGGQVVPDPVPPNARVLEHQLDPRKMYREARLILMPSQDLGTPGMRWWTESYGRIGIEAAASGIPTIAHPTPGLVESLGEAGIFCDRYRPQDWVKAIRSLDRPKVYERASAAALQRSAELDPKPQLDAVEAELVRIAEEWRRREREAPRPGDRATELRGNRMVKVRALRTFLGEAGKVRPRQVVEIQSNIARQWVRRGLAELVEQQVTPDVVAPAETQENPGPKEIKSGVTMTHRVNRGPSFRTREEAEEHHRKTETEKVGA